MVLLGSSDTSGQGVIDTVATACEPLSPCAVKVGGLAWAPRGPQNCHWNGILTLNLPETSATARTAGVLTPCAVSVTCSPGWKKAPAMQLANLKLKG